jgi:alkylated DNA repair dioxygenase AlkB
MDLFSNNNSDENLLPCDGIVNYYGALLPPAKAKAYFEKLLHTLDWKNDEVFMYGKRIVTKRKVAWYAQGPYAYTYSHTTKQALPWTKELLALKTLAEQRSGDHFNCCLLNLYHSGEEGMGWHSDDEDTIVPHSAIASLSLGAERKFAFKHKQNGDTVSLQLHNGSLLVMKGAVQTHWWHSLPKTKKVSQPRINLTFRSFSITGHTP